MLTALEDPWWSEAEDLDFRIQGRQLLEVRYSVHLNDEAFVKATVKELKQELKRRHGASYVDPDGTRGNACWTVAGGPPARLQMTSGKYPHNPDYHDHWTIDLTLSGK